MRSKGQAYYQGQNVCGREYISKQYLCLEKCKQSLCRFLWRWFLSIWKTFLGSIWQTKRFCRIIGKICLPKNVSFCMQNYIHVNNYQIKLLIFCTSNLHPIWGIISHMAGNNKPFWWLVSTCHLYMYKLTDCHGSC